ncbi:MAG TPA: hypothetical protein ENN56_04265, partial [Firmicutes bacterium]|nr:hypothetical protein [Bacillota bacterium]
PGTPIMTNPDEIEPIEIGTWEQLRSGGDIAILAVGSMVEPALKAAKLLEEKGVSSEIINARFVKPLDEKMLDELIARHDRWLTVEENVVAGGFGSAVLESLHLRMSEDADAVRVRLMGIPDRFTEHGTREEVLVDVHLSAADIVETAIGFLSESHPDTINAVPAPLS